ncbi:MAG TPA: NAD(P)-dependent oxidoreductase [Chloroflexota bacterium]|nr:NAD(P)-dependent oxidoreductase [Chloroflexota bacterium]
MTETAATTAAHATAPQRPVGFIGLGVMGEPMALNLVRAGTPLLVWNRTTARTQALAAAGAAVAADVADVFARAEVVILMLADEAAMDAVLDRRGPHFAGRVRGHTLVHMGTTAPAYSCALEGDVRAVGGHYVEAPVSGSRVPAQDGHLVALLAGEEPTVARVRPLLQPMCRMMLACGPVPHALLMKLAVNVFLLTLVTGLAESAHFAARHGLDLDTFAAALNSGQMASDISRVKVAKLLAGNVDAQAAIADVYKNARLIAEAARLAGAASPLIDVCHALYGEAVGLGLGGADMIAVLRAIEARDQPPG